MTDKTHPILSPEEIAERAKLIAEIRDFPFKDVQEICRAYLAQREALEKIERWVGEFPPSGRFWDKERTDPMSYGAAFGSNGERDYMRSIARAALEGKRQWLT